MGLFLDSNSWVAVAIGGVVVVCAFLFAAKPKPAKPLVDTASVKKVIGDTTILRLLDFEITELNRVPASNTITFVKGKVCKDTLKNKVNAVFKANPWLMGRVIDSKDFGQMALSYPTEFDPSREHDRFLFVPNASTLSTKMNVAEMGDYCKHYVVPAAEDSKDKDVPVVRFVLFEVKPDEEYALFVSMSHIIADGHTFYIIHSMLDLDTPVRSLIVDRNHNFTPLVKKVLTNELVDWFRTPALLCGVLVTILFGKKSQCTSYAVNDEAIHKIKGDYVETLKGANDVKAAPYLSSNDILTSWFFSTCKNTVCLMPINFRNRLDGITSDHAGNYERCILYNSADCSQPNFIRESITPDKGGVFRTRSVCLPSTFETMRSSLAVVTNWATFYKDIRITSTPLVSKDIHHRPVVLAKNAVFTDICIIYKSNESTTALSCNCRSVDLPKLVSDQHDSVKLLGSRLF